MSHVWAVRGDMPHRLDHTGLVGAGAGLALVGALAALVVTTDTSLGNTVGWPIWLVLYPLSPLIGYDLATRRSGANEEPLLLAGGYAVAVAAAHLAMAGGIAVCVALDLDSHSPLWMVLVALGVVVVAPARALALGAGRGLRGGGWALMGVAVLVLLGAWLVFFVAWGFWFARIDS